MDSKSLLNRLKADDETALRDIFYQYHASVYQTIVRIVVESNTAEDLVQDLFFRFWEKRHQLDIQGELGPYLRRMAVNEGLGHLRKNKKYSIEDIDEQFELSTEQSSDALQLHNELQVALDKAMTQLPPKCRTVFTLSRFEGLSYREIGEQMNISIKTVENQMGKALKVMRSLLKDYLTALLIFLISGIGAILFLCIFYVRIAMQFYQFS
jgi:RNA polymerase sigma-70 factor (ECF subfamily)